MIRVKVEIKMTETAKEPYAVIFTNEMTEAVRQAAAILEGRSFQQGDNRNGQRKDLCPAPGGAVYASGRKRKGSRLHPNETL